MNSEALKRGAVAGMIGGVVMAMWSMIVLAVTGSGFWTPLNLIAHTVWRSAPLGASFSVGALVIGLVIHMMMSMILGMVLAAAIAGVAPLRRNQAVLAMAGMVVGLVVWLIMQYGVWKVVDAEAARAFTPWVFAVGHLMYGAVTALVVGTRAATRRASTAQGLSA
ncbi:hypothetical protein [Amycolatopsis echigonensis]|uniref:Uncharacterized protein n=1 Tax=Amycolatopsis echigonensis TaxID=2576905 RepID=A0A8E1W5M9_9PSEU|nr:hypothetical protein [Amycolatopsis echigonensis]MBB2504034.1 hypothetical protein [Amycolatopsis echigonensis]